MIQLFLVLFVIDNFVNGFNETCGKDQTTCSEPFTCVQGFCLCSNLGQTSDSKKPLSFWTGSSCLTCPMDFTTTGTKCYRLLIDKDKQMNWTKARQRCYDSQSDLLVFRSEEEYDTIMSDLRKRVKYAQMYQRVPSTAEYFASIWIGTVLTDWKGNGQFRSISHAAPLTKQNSTWWSDNENSFRFELNHSIDFRLFSLESSRIGKQPSYLSLKETSERQACVALAIFDDQSGCMHNWFCSWETYALCEIHPPEPVTSAPAAIEVSSSTSSKMTYFLILAIALIVGIGICAFFCFRHQKKKSTHSARSLDSIGSEFSQYEL